MAKFAEHIPPASTFCNLLVFMYFMSKIGALRRTHT